MYLYDQDGKKVEVKADGESGSLSGPASLEEGLRNENKLLKEALKKMSDGETTAVDNAVKGMLKANPREELKEKQKALNQERKALNKTERIREEIAKKQNKFKGWKEGILRGVEMKSKEHTEEIARLTAELKDAETEAANNPEGDNGMDTDEDKGDSEDASQELAELRRQMGFFITYTQGMERRQQQMADQMTALMGLIQGQAENGTPFTPQQPLRITRSQPREKRSPRSRTPPQDDGLMEKTKIQEDGYGGLLPDEVLEQSAIEEAVIKQQLEALPGDIQERIWKTFEASGEVCKSFVQLQPLIENELKIMPKFDPKSLAMASSDLPITNGSPYGKAARGKTRAATPYQSPGKKKNKSPQNSQERKKQKKEKLQGKSGTCRLEDTLD